ncbi:BQ5605_C013g07088 [Microbotryum silenes-dioicae]|uniref:BQ5605_C013g07088 protein n=1 Tax=Microbotryum silenes-dioicae TaxID=796604 RepID=A0A2X0NV04_9BASI|nr:BQ5605_C013g07088 [Microbotryum silenes-dioicae]
MQSSLQSLRESVHDSDCMLELSNQLPDCSLPSSPRHGSTCSARLSGATRSSQEPGSATRNLIEESQSRRHASSRSVTRPRSNFSRPDSVTSTRPTTPELRHPSRAPSKQSLQHNFSTPSISTSDSWDEDETPYSQARQRLDVYSQYIASQYDGEEDNLAHACSELGPASSGYAASHDDRRVNTESKPFDIHVESDLYATSARARDSELPSVWSSREVQALADEMPQPPHLRKWLSDLAALNASPQDREVPVSSSSVCDHPSFLDVFFGTAAYGLLGRREQIRGYGSLLSDAASLISEATNSRAVDSLFRTAPEATPRSAWSLASCSSRELEDDPLLPGDYSFDTEEPSGYLESVSEATDEASSSIIHAKQVSAFQSESTLSGSLASLPAKGTGVWRLVSLALAVGWTVTIARSYWISDRAALEEAAQALSAILLEEVAVSMISAPAEEVVVAALPGDTESPSTMLLITLVFGAVIIPFMTAHHRQQPKGEFSPPEKGSSEAENADCMTEAIEAYTRGHLHKAKALFERVATGTPEQNRDALEYQARTLYRIGRVQDSEKCYSEAWELFHRVIETDKLSGCESSSATAKASMGRTMFRQGKVDGARIMLEQALRLDSKLAYAHEYLAKVIASMQLGAKGEVTVLGHLKEALRIDPDRYTARAFLGEWLHLNCKGLTGKKTTTRLRLAEEALEHVVTTRPDHVSAYARLALLARTRGDREAELAHWKRVLFIREEGFYDFDLSNETNDHARGDLLIVSICLGLNVSRETERLERIRLLSDALSKPSRANALLRLLQSIAIIHTSRDLSPKTVKIVFGAENGNVAASDSEDSKTIKASESPVAANTRSRSRKSSASVAMAVKEPLQTLATAKKVLENEEASLRGQIRQGTPRDKVELHGLLALALYGLGKSAEAKEQVKYYHYWLQLYAIATDETAATPSDLNATQREMVLRCELIGRALLEMAVMT